MKNLRITQSCLVNGDHQEPGTELKNVDNAIAADLVSSGRAVEIQEKSEVLGTRDPEPENRDPKGPEKSEEPTE